MKTVLNNLASDLASIRACGQSSQTHLNRVGGDFTKMKATLEHWRNGAIIHAHDIDPADGALFLKLVDSIRRNRHQSDGWILKQGGEIKSEFEVFGRTVCYGVKSPSFFNS